GAMAAQERVDPTGRGCHIVGRQQGGLQFGKRDVGILLDQCQEDRQEGLGSATSFPGTRRMRLKRSTLATLLAPTGRSGGAHAQHLPRCRCAKTLIHQRLEADPEVHRKYIGHDTSSQTG
ncbi:MAG: hypothetical protein MJH10_06855, partial [Epibacterium sp.]|nr:hypothetical protein [Epibacterium sp.]